MDENKSELKSQKNRIALALVAGLSQKVKTIVTMVIMLLIVIGAIVLISRNKEGQLTTISKSSLQKIIEINELSTMDYTYNAIATKYVDDKAKKVKYYVAYEGTVIAGIDFNKISIDVNEEEKKIIIIIPEAEIQGVNVDMGKMQYIFTKNKYETETVSQEAYKLCQDDLQNRIKEETTLYEIAKDNAVLSIEALLKPWIEAVDSDYKVEIK